MKVVVLFSGGKDSTYAAWWAVQQGFEIVSLLSALPQEGSLMFHHPNAQLTRLAAEAMGLPYESFEAGGPDEASELAALESALSKFSGRADAVVSGALASDYQKNRIDRICHKLGLISYAPLWHKEQESLLREIVAAGVKVIVAGVFAEGLGREWLGREIDSAAIDGLARLREKHGVSVAGEGGEWESFVLDSPIHRKRIEIVEAETVWEGSSGTFVIRKAELRTKVRPRSRPA